ncbi:hypothetical protein Tco_0532977 [Tanacetum coccineum]
MVTRYKSTTRSIYMHFSGTKAQLEGQQTVFYFDTYMQWTCFYKANEIKELSDEFYTRKFCKVNKEDRQDDDELRRQLQDDYNQCRYQGNVIEQHIFPSRELSSNQSGIIGVSFALSSQGSSSPKGFNTYTFIAENYLNFLSETWDSEGGNISLCTIVLEHVLMIESYTQESVPSLHKIR